MTTKYPTGTITKMGLIDRGDQKLHYSDMSHRWTAPTDVDQAIWEATMRAHLAKHQAGEHGQASPSPRDGTPPPTTGYTST